MLNGVINRVCQYGRLLQRSAWCRYADPKKAPAPGTRRSPASAPADPPAEGFRRSRRSRRRAAFGVSKPVSCEATLFEIIHSLFRKPEDVACTLSTLHKVFHAVFLVLFLLGLVTYGIANLVSGSDDTIKKIIIRVFALVIVIYMSFALSVSVKQAKNPRDGKQQLSAIIEIVVGLLYILSIGRAVVKGVPVLEQLVTGTLDSIKRIISMLPGGKKLTRTTQNVAGNIVPV